MGTSKLAKYFGMCSDFMGSCRAFSQDALIFIFSSLLRERKLLTHLKPGALFENPMFRYKSSGIVETKTFSRANAHGRSNVLPFLCNFTIVCTTGFPSDSHALFLPFSATGLNQGTLFCSMLHFLNED